MRANKSRDTKPELLVRRELHSRGRRYRVNTRPIAQVNITADIVFIKAKTAVFIDGCFWHKCPTHYKMPKANAEYWQKKINRNVARDTFVNESLAAAGWNVLRFWSHEDATEVANQIEGALLRTAPETGDDED